jgi:hypothetical protein
VHLLDGPVLGDDDIEAIALQLGAEISRVIHRVIELIAIRVSRIT